MIELKDSRQSIYAYLMPIPSHKLEEFKKLPQVISVKRLNAEYGEANNPNPSDPDYEQINKYFAQEGNLFPNPAHGPRQVDWTRDNYGPIYIPKKGESVELNKKSFWQYKKIIEIYEGNSLAENNGQYILNGEPATHYTFKQNYYWMMGDNRHNSL